MIRLGILLGFLAIEAFLAALHVPMLRGRVPPNRTYGLRTPATLGDERVWYAANRRAALEGIVTAAVSGVLGIAAYVAWPAMRPEAFALVLVAILLVGVLGGTAYAAWYAHRLARAVRERDAAAPGQTPAR